MKNKIFLLLSMLLLISINNIYGKSYCFNKDWKFTLSDSACYSFSNYKSTNWRTVNLPHDWSVELAFDSKKGEGCTGFLPGGIGWYSKEFVSKNTSDKKYYILFDGVYNNSDYWINGKKLGFHPYGYSPFYFDITDYLKPEGETNRIAVRVDHSHYADSRWYTGSGIYRSVKMYEMDKLHVPIWGTFITTPKVNSNEAEIDIKVTLENDYSNNKAGKLKTTFFDSKSRVVSTKISSFSIKGDSCLVFNQKASIKNPELWDVNSPNMYYAVTEVDVDGKIISSCKTNFGIRSIKFDADKGFFLNGVNRKIKGVCLHHDAGIIGTAFNKDVWRRRLALLKEAGCNAIRSSHNPAADDFLTLCDEMGFLVQDEFFDEWDNPKDKRMNMQEQKIDYITRGYGVYFQKWAEKDLKNTVLSSRNHPCIFQWSIGNEIEWTYPGCKEATGFFGADSNGNYFWNQPPYSKGKIKEIWDKRSAQTYDIGKTAHKLSAWTKELDTSRPVIANCILPSVSYVSGYTDALDIVGYSYRRVMYDYGKKNYPNKPIMGTENVGQWHEWKAVMDHDYISGMFIWTGIDYIGECGPGTKYWPDKSKPCGLLDLCGFKKPSFYMMKSLWVDEPTLAIYSLPEDKSSYEFKDGVFIDKPDKAWNQRLWYWEDMNSHWNYNSKENVIVEAYSNCDQVELYLNNKSLGKKYLKDFPDHIYKWLVPFKKGTLTAHGKKDNKQVISTIQTADKEHSIRLTLDNTGTISNDNCKNHVIHVIAQLIDKKGRDVQTSQHVINFEINGKYELLGVDNGSPSNVNPFKSSSVISSKGRCMLLIKGNEFPLSVKATSDNLESNELIINK